MKRASIWHACKFGQTGCPRKDRQKWRKPRDEEFDRKRCREEGGDGNRDRRGERNKEGLLLNDRRREMAHGTD